MCKMLDVSRSSVYYQSKKQADSTLDNMVKKIWEDSKKTYGTRNIKLDLYDIYGLIVSRRRISRVMMRLSIKSIYTTKSFNPVPTPVNNDENSNYLRQDFAVGLPHLTIVSDLTYVKVNSTWNYICLMIDLYNGEIVGHSCRKQKDSTIVKQAFSSISFPLHDIEIFHTDRGSEFKNTAIDETLRTFQIQHSLSRKGCPHDNAVAEATMKIIKTEFVNKVFDSLTTLERELNDYVNWYNNFRRHSRNGHKPPAVAA